MEFKINKTSSKKIKQAGELFPQSADVFVSLCSSNMTGKTLNFSIQFCYCKIKVLQPKRSGNKVISDLNDSNVISSKYMEVGSRLTEDLEVYKLHANSRL